MSICGKMSNWLCLLAGVNKDEYNSSTLKHWNTEDITTATFVWFFIHSGLVQNVEGKWDSALMIQHFLLSLVKLIPEHGLGQRMNIEIQGKSSKKAIIWYNFISSSEHAYLQFSISGRNLCSSFSLFCLFLLKCVIVQVRLFWLMTNVF